ncbi:unnamed protein product [Effrenium voratum]|uniref:Uncharacterized protein n=1 Tax=Effrenium voratum TaxID=2562239 RepID=A0AA36JM47_9DINO|nr:unnamed protein product [Effrenium voratum]
MRRRKGNSQNGAEQEGSRPAIQHAAVLEGTYPCWRRLGWLAPKSLVAFRLSLGLVVANDAMDKATFYVPAFYENKGSSYPRLALLEDAGGAAGLNPFAYFSGDLWPTALLAMTAISALGMVRWRWCSILTYVLVACAVLRNVYVSFIFDRYLLIGLLFSSCLPYDERYCLASVLFRLQLAWIYLDAGYGKVVSGDWSLSARVPALAVYLQGASWALPLLAWDRSHAAGCLVRVATWGTAWAEVLVAPILLAAAVFGASAQLLPMALVLLLHVGIGCCMEGGFSIGLAAGSVWLALLPTEAPKADRGLRCRALGKGDFGALAWVCCSAIFALSGRETQPGPVPTVLLLNRWQVFTGAETNVNWEVAPARLADGSVVDLWSWQNVSFAKPQTYGRRGRWLSFPSDRPGSAAALDARFQFLCGSSTNMETHRKHASHSQRDRDSRNPVPAFGPVKHAMRPAMSQLVLVLVAFSAGISLSRVGLSLGGTEADLLRFKLAAAWGAGPFPWTVEPPSLLMDLSQFTHRTQYLRSGLPELLAKGLCLDIGPKHRPILDPKHPNSRFLDHATREEIQKKYEDFGSMDQVPFIHYVWDPSKTYRDLVGDSRFQVVYASHVVEHVPDLVNFLNDVASILVDGGEFRLAVPDKRYCFDFRRRMTTFADIMGAHYDKCAANPVSGAYDELTLVPPKHNDAPILWASYPQDGDPVQYHDDAMRDIQDSLHQTGGKSAMNPGMHRWQFIPGSFVDIIARLHKAKLTSLFVRPGSVVETRPGTTEFLVTLVKS